MGYLLINFFVGTPLIKDGRSVEKVCTFSTNFPQFIGPTLPYQHLLLLLTLDEICFAAESNSVSNWSDPTMAEVKEINTMSRGKCLLWSTKLKATRTYPVVGLYIKAPPNE